MKKLLAILTVISMLILPLSVIKASDEVSIQVNQDPLLDVVLSVGNTDSTLTTFKEDLETLLVNRGIDLSKINITSISSNDVSASDTSIGWEKYTHTNYPGDVIDYYRPYYNETSGNFVLTDHITVSTVGESQEIDFKGYGSPAYKDFMYMPNTESGKKTIEFTIEEGVFYDALDGAGFLFNTHLSSNSDLANRTMSGYLLFLRYGSSTTPTMYLYKFENVDVNAFHNSTSSLVSNFSGFTQIDVATGTNVPGAETTRQIKIEATTSSVFVQYNGSDVTWDNAGGVEVTLPTAYESFGFGPITSYSSHNCSRPTQFTFKDIAMSTESSKKFGDVLLEPEWREGSERFIVNAEDDANPDFSDAVELGKIVTKLGNENVNYIGWGKTPADGQNLIAMNDGNGFYVDKNDSATANYTTQLAAIADYIETQYKSKIIRDTDILIYGRDNELVISPTSAQTDTIDETWPNGKWKVVHDENFYANPTGTVPYHDTYLNNLEIDFSQTGKYSIYYKDELEKEVFVHRLPVAKFNVSLDGSNNVTITNLSYDLDTGSNAMDGITENTFYYRESNSDVWISGQPTTLVNDKEYIIKLLVKDTQGVWSEPYLKYVSTSSASLPPTAEFSISSASYYRGVSQPISYNDTSYDPQGEAIISRVWTLYNSAGALIDTDTAATPDFDLSVLEEGNYKISLQVTDASNEVSETTSRFINVYVDAIAPTATLQNSETTYNEPFILNTLFEDNQNGSGLSHRYVVLANNTTTPTVWGSMASTNMSSIAIDYLGTYYLHYRVVDRAGNENIDYIGPITLEDTTAPTSTVVASNPDVTFTTEAWINVETIFTASGAVDDFSESNNIAYHYSTNGTDYVAGDSVTLNTEGEHDLYFKTIDEAGNESIKQIKIYFDLTAPNFDDIAAQTIESGISDIDWSTLITNESDNMSSVLEKSETQDDVDYNTPGSYLASVELEDQAGNKKSVFISITVEDTTDPMFDDIQTQTIEAGSTQPDWTTLIANEIDNSDTELSKRIVSDDVDYDTTGSYTVEVGLADQYGNETVKSFTVVVEDTTSPDFDAIDDQTIPLNQDDRDWSELIENITDNSTSEFTKIEVIDNVDYDKVGTYTATVKVTDESGNFKERTINISVIDVVDPTFDDILAQTIEAGGNDVDWTTVIENLQDDSNEEVITSEDIDGVDYNTPGQYIVLVTGTDKSGNTTSKNIVVNVIDTTRPTFEFNPITEIEAGTDEIDWSTFVNQVSDNSDGRNTVSIIDEVDYDTPGTYPVTAIVTDSSGNQRPIVVNVKVVDTISPTFDEIADQKVNQFDPEVDWYDFIEGMSDNSDQPLTREIIENINYDEVGTYPVTVVVTDSSGNKTEFTFNVEVIRVVTIVEGPDNGTVTVEDGEVIYEEDNQDDPENESDIDVVTFKVKEKDGEVTYKTVYKTNEETGEKEEIGTGISLQDEAFEVKQGGEVEISVAEYIEEIDKDKIQITVNGEPVNGEVTINDDGTITYKPDSDYIGEDATVIEITDGTKTMTFVASFEVQESNPLITKQCLINWMLGLILLLINYLVNKKYYLSKKGRTTKYAIAGIIFIVFLCILSRIFGATIPYVLLAIYFASHFGVAYKERKTA